MLMATKVNIDSYKNLFRKAQTVISPNLASLDLFIFDSIAFRTFVTELGRLTTSRNHCLSASQLTSLKRLE